MLLLEYKSKVKLWKMILLILIPLIVLIPKSISGNGNGLEPIEPPEDFLKPSNQITVDSFTRPSVTDLDLKRIGDKLSLTILTLKSHPQIGSNWTISFNTTGTANLTITGVSGTSFGEDIIFKELRCGSSLIDADYNGERVFVEDYSCNEIGRHEVIVLTFGHHYQEFDFGGITAVAENDVYGCKDGHCIDDNVTDWTAGTFVNTTWNDTNGNVGNVSLNLTGMLRGLISYWKMDDASGGIVDAHGDNDGTENGDPTYSQTGIIGTSIDFDGTGDWFNCGDAPFDITDKLSISIWVKPGQIAEQEIFFSKDYPSFEIDQLRNERFTFWINVDTLASTTLPAIGTWYHIVVTYDKDGGTNNKKIYVNGTIETQETQVGAIATNAYELQIGRRPSTTDYSFDGLIDEVGIWDRVLSPTEISELWNDGDGLAYSRYFPKGNFTSQVFNAGSSQQWNNLTFSLNIPTGTNITFYARSCSSSCTTESWSNGHLEASSGVGNFILNTTITPDNQYFQYYTLLQTSSTSLTPYLEWVNVSYTPDTTAPTISNQINWTTDRLTYVFSAQSNENSNCSLWGNWSGTFIINQTLYNVTLNTQFNYTPITFPQDENHIWNVNCSDTSFNDAFGTNITFSTFVPDLCVPTKNQDWILTTNLTCTNYNINTGTGYLTIPDGTSLTIVDSNLTIFGRNISKTKNEMIMNISWSSNKFYFNVSG